MGKLTVPIMKVCHPDAMVAAVQSLLGMTELCGSSNYHSRWASFYTEIGGRRLVLPINRSPSEKPLSDVTRRLSSIV